MAQPPNEMFTLLKSAPTPLSPRQGRLSLPNRTPIQTPHYLASTSRGAIPHLTPDNVAAHSDISGVYVPLEDFIERAPERTPPIYKIQPLDGGSSLRRFIALPDETLLVLGDRRTTPVTAPAASSNTNTSIAVSTAVGFKTLEADDYAKGVERLGADVVIALADVPYGRAVGSKRVEKATDRSIEWLQSHVALRKDKVERAGFKGQGKLFAALLPVSSANQQFYIESLSDSGVRDEISGLAVHSLDTLEDLPSEMAHLPRIGFTEPSTPHNILRHVAAGLDILTVPFMHAATDNGIAFDFAFPAPSSPPNSSLQALGIDMWSPTHATDLSPLRAGCECYACTHHHRAYVQHLLSAKEMLAWVLLQLHNHYTLSLFFAGIRQSLAEGTFEDDVRGFAERYEPNLPEKTGQGPRLRGYQIKSEGPGESKKNKKAFTTYHNGEIGTAKETPAETKSQADADGNTFDLKGGAFSEMHI